MAHPILDIIRLDDPTLKVLRTAALHKQVEHSTDTRFGCATPEDIDQPGYPQSLTLVPPKHLKRRGIQEQAGRNVLMHAIAHIEFNAINLALDAAYRFTGLPDQYYRDWIGVAADEARHFSMVTSYLRDNGQEYGDYPAHNGLWNMAKETNHDALARMALVPRVMEARGLDVTPDMIERLRRVGDDDAVAILRTIYDEEIAHVRIGSYWFEYLCHERKLEPTTTFFELVSKHYHGNLRGPFNMEARNQSGFSSGELQHLKSLER